MQRRFLLPFLLMALLVVPFAFACGGDDDDDDTAGSTATATTTTAATATETKAAYPIKVKDLLGREVEIKAQPKTVVALSPSATEFVYAAGGTIVGRTTSVDYPEAAKQAKDVGTAYQPNFETILSLKPDLIVADSVIHESQQLRKPIEDLGIPVIFAGAESYQQVIDGLNLMGKVYNADAKTKEVISGIEKALADSKAKLAGKNLSAVFLIADRDQTLYAAKNESYAGDIMKQLGLTNPAAGQPDAGPFPGYTTVAPEKLVQFNPDYIYTITPAPAPAPRLSTLIPQVPPFKGLKAVTGNHVVEADVQIFLQAPGPRIADAFKFVAQAAGGQ